MKCVRAVQTVSLVLKTMTQRVGVIRDSRPQSVVEISEIEGRNVALSKSGLLAHFELHHIEIVSDTSSPRKFKVLLSPGRLTKSF